MGRSHEKQTWIFGYGSLIWKPPPHTVESFPGFIKGFVRRFWQASEDHRGTKESPGRVATLISREEWQGLDDPHHSDEADVTWGMAYRIDPNHALEVQEYLAHREKNGYSISTVPVWRHLADCSPVVSEATLYIGTTRNPQFVGPQDVDELAAHIFKSRGPSGENKEYLLNLDTALSHLDPETRDEHVRDLSCKVRQLENKSPCTVDDK